MKSSGKLRIVITLMAALFASALLMTACGGKKQTTTPTVPPTITLEQQAVTLEMGQSADIGYTTTDYDGKVTVEYDTAKLGVFILDAQKKIHIYPLAVGEDKVTVRAGTVSAVLTVTSVPSNSESPFQVAALKELYMTMGQTSPVSLNAKIKLNGEDTDGELSYLVSPEGVVTVSENGTVTAKAVGKALIAITAKKDGYDDVTATCAVCVYPDADILFERPQYTLILDGEKEVTPTVTFVEEDEPVADPQGVEYVSGNVNVATVDATTGKITATGVGKTSITASWKGLDVSVDVEVYATVTEISSAEGLRNMNPDNYYKLTADLTFDFTADPVNCNKSVVDTVNATLDGNGHTISMNVVTGDSENRDVDHTPHVLFAKTVGEKGVIKNTYFEYNLTTVSNSRHGYLLIETNNGVIKDCEIHLDAEFYWHYDDLYLVASAGEGRVENLIVYADIKGGFHEYEPPAGGNAFLDVYGKNAASNILVFTSKKFDIPEGAQNIIKIAGVGDFSDSGFITADFYTDEAGSIWSEEMTGLPVFFSVQNLQTVTVASLSDITAHKNERVSYELTQDIEITMTATDDDTASQKQSIIPTLYGIFDGKGHTITINAVGSEHERDLKQSFIDTISGFGVFKNTKVVYKCDWNATWGTGLIAVNNGTMENLEIKVEHKNRWLTNGITYICGGGTGVWRNSVAVIDRTSNYGASMARFALCGGNIDIQNVLAIDSIKEQEITDNGQTYTIYGISEKTDRNANFVVLYDSRDFTESGFNTEPFAFDAEGSYWKRGFDGMPSFTEWRIATVSVGSIEDIAREVATYGNNATINFNLTQDIVYSGTSAATLIPELYGTFNGNGHKITVTANFASVSGESPRLLLVGTIASSGVVENLNLEYTLNISGNAYHTAALFANNNGIIRNCDIKVTHSVGWLDGGNFSPLGGGSGTLENVVLNVQIPDKGTLSDKKIYVGGKTFKNVLIVTNMTDRIETDAKAQKQNTVTIESVEAFDKSGFATTSFNLDGTDSVWKSGFKGIPSFTKWETHDITVNKLEDITKAVADYGNNATLNFDLQTDLNLGTVANKGTEYSLIPKLYGTFNGNGHTITVNVTHGSDVHNKTCYMNFVNTVADTGVIQNTKFVYNFTSTANTFETSFITKVNNGSICNCEFEFTCSFGWVERNIGFISYEGNGTFENLVVRTDIKSDYDFGHNDSKNKLAVLSASTACTARNVLGVLAGGNDDAWPLVSGQNNPTTVVNVKHCYESTYKSCGFNATSFKIGENGSVWKSGFVGIPSFTEVLEYNVTVNSLDDIKTALTTYGSNAIINFTLNCDLDAGQLLYITDDDISDGPKESAEGATKSIIPKLYGIFDGNGHTVKLMPRVLWGSGGVDLNLCFIHEIAASGVLKNTVFEYSYPDNNVNTSAGIVSINSGVAENLEIKVNHTCNWLNSSFYYLARNGKGTFRNIVAHITRTENGKNANVQFRLTEQDTCTLENVLVICEKGVSEMTDTSSNIVVIDTADAYATSGFVTTSFDTSLWDLTSVPTLKAQTSVE